MYYNQHLKIILLIIVIGICTFAVLSANNRVYHPIQPQDNSEQSVLADGEINSDSGKTIQFSVLEYTLRNKPVENKTQLENELLKIENDFEQKYLLSILKKRSGEFQESYNLLLELLTSFPAYLSYYDELADFANITGNLDTLELKLNNLTENNYILYLKGLISYKKSNYKDALKNFQQIIDNDFVTKEVYYWLAYINRGLGNYQTSIKLLEQAYKLTDENDLFAPKITLAIGSLHYLSGNHNEAFKYYKRGYDLAKKQKNTLMEIRGLANLAIIEDESGNVEKARQNLTTAIMKAKKIENAELLAYLYSEIGVSYSFTNEIIKARKNYLKSYTLYIILNNRERLAYLSNNIASIYLQIANYKESLKNYNAGLKYAGDNKLGRILNLTGIADVYSNMANYSKALEYYNKAKELADSINDISSKVKIDIGIGSLYYNINRTNSSLNYFYNAEENIKPEDMPFIASDIYLKIATVETSLKNYRTAEKYFKKTIKLTRETGDIYYNIVAKTEFANALIELGKLKSAEKLLHEAQKVSIYYDLKQLAGLQKLYLGKIKNIEGDIKEALNNFKEAYNFSSEVSDFNNQIEAGFLIAKTEADNDTTEAEKWYKSTIDLIEKVSGPLVTNSEVQISHFSAFNEVYESFIDFYLSNGNTKEAYYYLERSRSRNTLQNLVNLKLINSDVDEQLINKYSDLNWMIKSNLYSDEKVSELTKSLNELKKQLTYRNENLAGILDQNHALHLTEIQNSLNADEFVISFFVNDDYIQEFLVGKTKYESVRIEVGKNKLISLIKEITPLFKSNITKDELFVNQDLFAFNAHSAGRLYNNLFKNILENVPGESKIIFSLPNELLIVPVEFLVTNWEDDQSAYYYSDKNFLIEKYPISYTPSASIYIRQKESERNNGEKILLVGDPDITNDEFSISYRSGLLEDETFSSRNIELFPLEFSKDEIEGIDKFFNEDVVLLSEDATETNLKKNAPDSKVIHLSTHSFLLKDQPLIIFSQQSDKTNDGFLEMGEIVQMNLNADLVVLSSCRSGLGKIDEAEGILGMQKSFFDAGANSIVVSLWDVNDKYTSVFMKNFYKNLSDGKDKSEALRFAKIDFIKNYSPNPYYWSAFILAGDVSKVHLKSRPTDLYYYLLGVFILIASGFILKQRYNLYRKMRSQFTDQNTD